MIDKEGYLLELCRYIVLNPVRSGIVNHPGKWPWSSYRAMLAGIEAPDFLNADWILSLFHSDGEYARKAYERFVLSGIGEEKPWKDVRGRVMLGGDQFIGELKGKLERAKEIKEIPKQERFSSRPSLSDLFSAKEDKPERNRVIHCAHLQYGYTLKEIAGHLGIHYTTVSKILLRGLDGDRGEKLIFQDLTPAEYVNLDPD